MGKGKSLLGSLFVTAVSKQVNKSKINHVTTDDAKIAVRMGWNEAIEATSEKIVDMVKSGATPIEMWGEVASMIKPVPKPAEIMAWSRRERSESVINNRIKNESA